MGWNPKYALLIALPTVIHMRPARFFLTFGIFVLLVVDILHEKEIPIYRAVNSQEIWFRWILYLGLIWTVIMFGIYGTAYDASTFIYLQL